jgi:hypothetical protein
MMTVEISESGIKVEAVVTGKTNLGGGGRGCGCFFAKRSKRGMGSEKPRVVDNCIPKSGRGVIDSMKGSIYVVGKLYYARDKTVRLFSRSVITTPRQINHSLCHLAQS